jgi:hypothetical protein
MVKLEDKTKKRLNESNPLRRFAHTGVAALQIVGQSVKNNTAYNGRC